jgi:RNA polymerase sigma-70 factor (ECF subfamily)
LRDFRRLEDRDLLEAAKADREAFGELYRRHGTAIGNYFSRAVGRSELARDLTSETFVSALQALPGYKPSTVSGGAWLFSIAHSRLVDYVRRRRVEARALEQIEREVDVAFETGADPVDGVIARIDGRAAIGLLDDLPREQRDALRARFIEDHDYPEIAAGARCSEQAARKRVSRGLVALRAHFESAQVATD